MVLLIDSRKKNREWTGGLGSNLKKRGQRVERGQRVGSTPMTKFVSRGI